MMETRQRRHEVERGWLLLAATAIGFAILLLLVSQVHNGSGDLAAILPFLFVGLISPLSLLGPLAFAYAGRVPEAPVRAALFERPPPSLR
jgi:hypothetical protein